MARKSKLSEDAQEVLEWIEEGWYDTEHDMIALVDALASRFAYLRFVTNNEKAHEGPKLGALFSDYRSWWIKRRYELKCDGVSDKEMLPLLGVSKLANYAEVDGDVGLAFPELEHTVNRRKVIPFWVDGEMKDVPKKSVKLMDNAYEPEPDPNIADPEEADDMEDDMEDDDE